MPSLCPRYRHRFAGHGSGLLGAAVAAAPVGLFIAISAGRLQAYLIHLAPQRQTLLAEFAGRVPDLYLRSGVAQRQAAFDAGWARAGL